MFVQMGVAAYVRAHEAGTACTLGTWRVRHPSSCTPNDKIIGAAQRDGGVFSRPDARLAYHTPMLHQVISSLCLQTPRTN